MAINNLLVRLLESLPAQFLSNIAASPEPLSVDTGITADYILQESGKQTFILHQKDGAEAIELSPASPNTIIGTALECLEKSVTQLATNDGTKRFQLTFCYLDSGKERQAELNLLFNSSGAEYTISVDKELPRLLSLFTGMFSDTRQGTISYKV